MRNLTTFIKELQEQKIETSGVRIKQTVRNELKRNLTKEIALFFTNLELNDVNVKETLDGVAIQIEGLNENITFVLDPVFKNLDYDIEHEHALHLEKEQARAELERKRAEKVSKK